MNASSGSGLWPRRISMGAGGLRGLPVAVSAEPLSESIQHYLREIYKLAGRASGRSR